MFEELLWLLPWCYAVNMSLNVLGFVSKRIDVIGNLDAPFDFNKKFPDGSRILGNSTTWGGFILTALLGGIGEVVFPHMFFFTLALLVFFGHALGSFIKRRLKVLEGDFLPFVDHGDYMLVAGVFLITQGTISLPTLLVGYFGTLMITPAVTVFAHRLGVRAHSL